MVALFAQATELYRPVSMVAGVSARVVGVVFIAVFAGYLLVNVRSLITLFSTRLGLVWAIVLLVAPFAMLIAQYLGGDFGKGRLLYWLSFNTLFATMFAASVLLWHRYGAHVIRPFFIAAIGAAWCGIVVNVVNRDFIRDLIASTDNNVPVALLRARVFGFFPHPNTLAFALCVFLAVLVANRGFIESRIYVHVIVLLAVIAGVALTLSRTSAVLLVGLICWYVLRLVRSTSLSWARVSWVVAGSAGFLLVAAAVLSHMWGIDVFARFGERVASIQALLFGNSDGDKSLALRTSALQLYVDDFLKQPWTGYGPDYATQQIAAGVYPNVSQNAWLEWAVKYGFVYPVLVGTAFVMTFRAGLAKRKSDPWVWYLTAVTLVVVAAASLSVVNFLWLRFVVIGLGAVVGVLMHSARNEPTASGGSSADRENG